MKDLTELEKHQAELKSEYDKAWVEYMDSIKEIKKAGFPVMPDKEDKR